MRFERQQIKDLITNGNLIVACDKEGKVTPVDQWTKWLSYVPEFEKDRIYYLESGLDGYLSINEREELNRHLIQEYILTLLIKYNNKNIDSEDCVTIFEYIVNNSFEDLMLSKLSLCDLLCIKSRIKELENLSFEKLHSKLDFLTNVDVYNDLNMIDSYIVYFLSKMDNKESIKLLDKSIKNKTLKCRM